MKALVIGGGPAGLMAAEALTERGIRPVIAEAKPTLARKFLMAGKSGLNLTKDEDRAIFAARISDPRIAALVRDFGPPEVKNWAIGLEQSLFTGSSGRVFPVGMKASPLLRAWATRLSDRGAEVRTRWRWTGFEGQGLAFETPDGPHVLHPEVTILALGGASWPRLGSDAAWVPWLAGKGVAIAPFRPANMGLVTQWSDRMAPHLGHPVKGAALSAGGRTTRAEFVLSARGIEGGGIYELAAPVRDGAALTLDLAPDLDLAELTRRLDRPRGKQSIGNHLRRTALPDPIKLALFLEWGRPLPDSPAALAARIKALPVRHDGPRPLTEAISSAGGIMASALTDDLELRALPGIFAAGEMLDWEAPTGGYLLTACLASGRQAGRAAAQRL